MTLAEMDAGRLSTKHARERIAVWLWNFGGAIKGQDIQCRVKMRDGAARFQGNATMAANRKVECDNSMRHRKRRVHIAIFLAYTGDCGCLADVEGVRLRIGIDKHRQLFNFERN